MSKDTFKVFAKNHPELANTVLKGNATWQQLYELYEIYGENNSIWNNYFSATVADTVSSSASTLQKGITNLQKTIGLLQDIGIGNKKEENRLDEKTIYKRFDD